jgi:cob(I)alamin adenosyltransferase
MSIITKNGDNGLTNLTDTKNVSKSDDRVELIGVIEELVSNIGLIRVSESSLEVSKFLEHIQQELLVVIRWVSKPFDKDNKIQMVSIKELEDEITRLEEKYSIIAKEHRILINNTKSAQADVTRTIARRAERRLIDNDKKYGGDKNIKMYMNRISDYFYVLSVMYSKMGESTTFQNQTKIIAINDEDIKMDINQDAVIQAVLSQIKQVDRVNLDIAKTLIEKLERYSKQKGMNCVIAVCGPEGNMIAVHNMDGAFLASFDVAMKKAYTAVAVQMPTLELGKLAVPGGTFYGVDKADNGKIIVIGGGIPLSVGNRIVGGLGVSGGTGEQDHEVALYGQSVLNSITLKKE